MGDQILNPFPTLLIIRWVKCSPVQQLSIRTSVILVTISTHLLSYTICFLCLDAMTKLTQPVRLDRGVLFQLVLLEWTSESLVVLEVSVYSKNLR